MKEKSCGIEAKTYILKQIEKILQTYPLEKTDEALKLILEADKVFIYGVGRSGLVGKAFAMRLVQIGLKAYFIGETITPIIEPSDVAIVISRTGETYSAIQAANIVRRVGAKLIVITSHKGSKLSHIGTVTLYLTVNADKRRMKYAPLGTLFENATLIFLDSLVSELMEMKGETEETMKARHPILV